MPTKYKISIPEPCQEDWNFMTPKDNGRFCGSCSKNVVDFTNMLPDEIQHYFILNQNKSVCGRFKNTQLDEIIIQIPSRVLYSQMNYHRMFILSLFICMGTTLFSCKQENGIKQKIDKIEVIVSSGNTKKEDQNDSKKMKSKIPCEPLIPLAPIEQYNPVTVGMPVFRENEQDTISNGIDYDTVFELGSVETRPNPTQGIDKFYQFIKENYIAPQGTEEFSGSVFVSFIIEKDGSLSNFKIIRAFGTGTGEEVIRILQTSEKWIPAQINNHLVKSLYILPISFNALK